MSDSSTISTAVPTLRKALSPRIVGLFVQGLESGLVLAQLSSWLSIPEHTESLFVVSLTVFVTIVGLWASCVSCISPLLLTIIHKAHKRGFALPLHGEYTWQNLGNPCVTPSLTTPGVHMAFHLVMLGVSALD